MGQPRQQPQRDVRQQRPRVDGRHRPSAGQSRLLQAGIEPSLLEGRAHRQHDAARDHVRSVDAEVRCAADLFQLAPSAVRLRQGQHAVAVGRRVGSGLGQHPHLGRDAGHREVAGLDAHRPRHQRQRQARRVHRDRQAAGRGQGHAHHGELLRHHAPPTDGSIWGSIPRQSRRRRSPRARRQSVRDGAGRNLQRSRPGFGVRGGDIDKNGVVWVSLRQRAHRRVRPFQVQGPAQWPEGDGDHCPEGGFLQISRPGLRGIGDNSAEASYYTWVDQHNILGWARTCRCRRATSTTA